MANFELPGHVLLSIAEEQQPCLRCSEPIRLARKLATRHPLNRWAAVPASASPGRTQFPAASLHTCTDLKRRTPLRTWFPRA
jgi:hypothetical protein